MHGKGTDCCSSGSGCGCGCHHHHEAHHIHHNGLSHHQKVMLLRMGATVALLVALHFVPVVGLAKLLLYLVPYLIMGYDILLEAWEGIRNREVFDENFLMTVATIGALVLGVTSTGDYTEAVAVLLFYQAGEWFEGFAVGRSRRNISQLMDIRPDYANIMVGGRLQQVPPESLEIGSLIVVQPGEKVPLDGVIVEGSSTLNTVALTGESLPREVAAGDAVASGCINMRGVLTIRTTRTFSESTVAKILELVEYASARKSRSEAFISRFARVYTPAVCYGAIALAIIPPAIRLALLGLPPEWGSWFYRALTFLVISCPCALVISIPLTFFAGIGGASRVGILIKGSHFLEALSQIKCMVFDKTGTLTQGSFQVTAVTPVAMTEHQLLEMAALAECSSSHPVAKSILRAYGREPDRSRIQNLQEIGGQGLVAQVDGRRIAVGNGRLMEAEGIAAHSWEGSLQQRAGTQVFIAIDKTFAGSITVSDSLKPTAVQAIKEIKDSGVQQTVMLTGDTDAVAQEMGGQLGMDCIHSQLLPGDKVSRVEELLEQLAGKGKLAFVGDGINDAPVLSRSDIGIAMGALGSDAAIEAADVVLMDDNPLKIPTAIRISRKTMGIVGQNIGFALGIKFLCLILGALGLANMWLAIFADVGVMLLAVLNAIRALSVKNL